MQTNVLTSHNSQFTGGGSSGNRSGRFLGMGVLVGLLITGCTALQQDEKMSQQALSDAQQGDRLLKELRQPRRQRTIIHHEPWVDPQAIKLLAPRLPEPFNCDITFATGAPMPLPEFSKLINKLCGLPVRVSPDAEAKLLDQVAKRQPPQGQAPQEAALINGIRWQGKLTGLLDTVSTSLGLYWRYSHQAISLYYLDSRTFQLYAIPSETEVNSTVHSGIDVGMGGSGSSSKGSGQSSQDTKVSLKSSMVKDMYRSIQSLLTKGIGQLSASPSTGSVTATDTPEVLDRIAHYIQHENRTITKQVLLNIKVLAVELHDAHQLGIDWNLIYAPHQDGLSGLKDLQVTPKDTSSVGNTSILKISGSGHWSGAHLLLEALAHQGKVSVVTSPSVTTLNLQPVPVQVATQKSYLARTEVTQKAKGDTTYSLTPGMITHGFSMDLLPFVMADNQLLLQYAINVSELIDIQKFGFKDKAEIQLPEISSRLFSQKVKLQSGETLVLSGFEQTRSESQRKGTGNVHSWLLGGGVKANQNRTIIVLMITPIVMA